MAMARTWSWNRLLIAAVRVCVLSSAWPVLGRGYTAAAVPAIAIGRGVLLVDAANGSDNAVCLDGSPAVYYHRKGTGSGINKWIISQQGGGWCSTAAECASRAQTALGSTSHDPPSMIINAGYMSVDKAINPMMWNWNAVVLRYCDGGSLSGDKPTPTLVVESQASPRPPAAVAAGCAPGTFRNASHVTCEGLKPFLAGNASAALCQNACCADPACVTWQWIDASHPASSCWGGVCTTSPPRANANWVGGERADAPSPPPPLPPPAPPNVTALHFRGRAILDAQIDSLLHAQGMSTATDIVVSGCSAGGLATFLHCDRWAAAINESTHGQAKVACVPDSGFFLDAELGPRYETKMRNVFTLHESSTAGLDADCVSAHTGAEWRCMFAQWTAPFISTPTFALQSKYDAWQSTFVSGACKGWPPHGCDATAMNELGGNLSLLSPLHMHGAFLDACQHHCGTGGAGTPPSGSNWGQTAIGGATAAVALQKWYEALYESPRVGRDSSHFYNQERAFPCTECCTDGPPVVAPNCIRPLLDGCGKSCCNTSAYCGGCGACQNSKTGACAKCWVHGWCFPPCKSCYDPMPPLPPGSKCGLPACAACCDSGTCVPCKACRTDRTGLCAACWADGCMKCESCWSNSTSTADDLRIKSDDEQAAAMRLVTPAAKHMYFSEQNWAVNATLASSINPGAYLKLTFTGSSTVSVVLQPTLTVKPPNFTDSVHYAQLMYSVGDATFTQLPIFGMSPSTPPKKTPP